jgi:hypothetical protein
MNILARSTHALAAGAAAAVPALFAFGCGGDDGGNGGNGPNLSPTVTSVSVNPTSVVGGSASQGSVSVNPAPGSAVNVNLSSSNAAATVPASVTVNGGATTGAFTVNTTPVAASTPITISATLNGTVTTILTVTPPTVPTASFVVRSLSPAIRDNPDDNVPPVEILPTGTLDACPLASRPGISVGFDCVFDGSASTAPAAIQEYIWTYFVGPRQREERSPTPVYRPSESSCNFFGGLQSASSGGLQFIGMRVDLQVRDATGAVSSVVSSQNIRVFPAGQCGYGF